MSVTKISIQTLNKYECDRKLRSSRHPYHELIIWNYLETVHYDNKWDDITMLCRGLVTDTDGNIMARSFGKFFNYEENKHKWTDDHQIFDKADGSLFLVFNYTDLITGKSEWICASRGSFISDQAKEGKKILEEIFPQYVSLDIERTYVFELIYPENKIVVEYEDLKTLIYITSFHKDGTEIMAHEEMKDRGFNVIKEFPTENKSPEELQNLNTNNAEGFVVRFANGERVKIKFSDYIRNHRISTNLTVKMVYDMCQSGDSLETMLEKIPDELNPWFRDVYNKIMFIYNKHYNNALRIVDENVKLKQKDFAKKFSSFPNAPVIFALRSEAADAVLRKKIFAMIPVESIKVDDKNIGFKSKNAQGPVPTLIILIGRVGTFKQQWIKRYIRGLKNYIVVNRKRLRNTMFSIEDERDLTDYNESKNFKDKEKILDDQCESLITSGITNKSVVIVDDETFSIDRIKTYLRLTTPDTNITHKIFGAELSCVDLKLNLIALDSANEEIYLEKQTIDFNRLIEQLPEQLTREFGETMIDCTGVIQQNIILPKCVVFDIDGTIADNVSGRSPYDMTRVSEDVINPNIVSMLNSFVVSGMAIILCTGRTDDCRSATAKWLTDNNIVYSKLYMRKTKDDRKDFIVKKEFWLKIIREKYIVAMFDDRNQVVDYGRKHGFTMCQVAEGKF
jgi:RNA ligase